MTELRRPQLPLHVVGENVLRILRLAHEHLESLPQRGRVGMACANVGLAIEDLERALDAHVEGAQRELRETVLTALGPDIRYSDMIAFRRAFELVLACLDLPGEGEAA